MTLVIIHNVIVILVIINSIYLVSDKRMNKIFLRYTVVCEGNINDAKLQAVIIA